MNDFDVAAPVQSSPEREFQWWQLRPPDRIPRRRIAVAVAGLLVLAALIAYGVHWWRYSQAHVSTDDAFITGHIAPVSARIAGSVVAVLASDNQDVKAGDVLMRLDPRDYQVALAQARAAVEAARGELANALANVPLTDDTTRSQLSEADASLAAAASGRDMSEHDLEQRRSELRSRQGAVAAAEAAVRAAESDADRARLDRDRISELFRTQLVARQDFDHADAAAKNAQALLEVARHKLAQARDDASQSAAGVQSQGAALAQSGQRVAQAQAALANATGQRQQVKLREASVDAARGRLQLAAANFEQAQLNLDYATIRAPVGGRVTKKSVEVGQVLQAGQPLLSIVDLDDLWVLANFKETELTHVRPGQSVRISIDTYPDATFKGRVDSIQSGSGAVFSVLPPENATGNYVKIVQRIPVKIVLLPGENARHLLVPGMSVVPTIALR